ncbi:MAG TPA: hypothetical protein PK957_04995 [Candidatus Dojkabacteria bacterium]|nr:hypothetical protein [Candidatus Dojkabacteria bacterium]
MILINLLLIVIVFSTVILIFKNKTKSVVVNDDLESLVYKQTQMDEVHMSLYGMPSRIERFVYFGSNWTTFDSEGYYIAYRRDNGSILNRKICRSVINIDNRSEGVLSLLDDEGRETIRINQGLLIDKGFDGEYEEGLYYYCDDNLMKTVGCQYFWK